ELHVGSPPGSAGPIDPLQLAHINFPTEADPFDLKQLPTSTIPDFKFGPEADDLIPPRISITGIAIAGGPPTDITISGNNFVEADKEKQGFTLSGTETGADFQTVTVTFANFTFTTTASGGHWSVDVP